MEPSHNYYPQPPSPQYSQLPPLPPFQPGASLPAAAYPPVSKSRHRTRARWIALVLAALFGAGAALGVGAVLGGVNLLDRYKPTIKLPVAQTVTVIDEQQVVRALTQKQEIILLQLGITDIIDQTNQKVLFQDSDKSINIPGTKKTMFLKVSFDTKLGIDGRDVQIIPLGNNRYEIDVPKFHTIGFDNADTKVATESKGVLGWLTEDIDPLELQKQVFDTAKQAEYVDQYQEFLRAATENFYRQIINGVDPTVQLVFRYAR